jgi:preprotein translocase subunit SecG
MITIVTIIHILICLFLVFIVLIQSGKGAEMGAAFGGSSQTLFGSRGAATFLNKLTTVAAVLFMITSLVLTILTTKPSSVIKDVVAPQGQGQTLPPPQIPQEPISKPPATK